MSRISSSFALVSCAFVILGSTFAVATEPKPPGSIEFVGENALMTGKGRFHDWKIVRATFDRDRPSEGVVAVEIRVASLDTEIESRDEHLRSADFFDVEKWPTATARVHGAVPDGTSAEGLPRYRAKFEITIRDVTQTIDGTFELVETSPPTVAGSLVLNRVAFGIGTPDTWWNPASIDEEIPVRFRAILPEPEAPSPAPPAQSVDSQTGAE